MACRVYFLNVFVVNRANFASEEITDAQTNVLVTRRVEEEVEYSINVGQSRHDWHENVEPEICEKCVEISSQSAFS